jgi:predicted dehydrogenase
MAIRIGLVDHHLNNWHADTFLNLMRNGKIGADAEIAVAWESHPVGEDWFAKTGVPRADSLEDAVRAADAVMLLAPDNIEFHREFAERVLPFGKPTFVDKYLAPNVADAQAIVALAERHDVPLLCSSALRYAQELTELLANAPQPVTEMYSRGMGRWQGYGIHSVSPVVRTMGGGAKRIIDVGVPGASVVSLDYGDGRRATIDVRACENGYDVFSWQLGIRDGNLYRTTVVRQFEQFYANQMQAICAFFASQEPDITPEQAIEIVAILEGAARSLAAGGVWIALPL